MMKSKLFIWLLATFLLTTASHVEAQQPTGKVPRIGFLTTGSVSDPRNALSMDTLRQALRELGYVEGKNINFEYRYAEGNLNNCRS
jgi:putative tryptophan/tyrosine transport system substrate-binding protein